MRDHLKAIFAKVGVASRGELVAKLFAEHYYPGIHAPGAYEHVEVGLTPRKTLRSDRSSPGKERSGRSRSQVVEQRAISRDHCR